MELIFEVIQNKAGGFSATCLNAHAHIDTKASDLEELDRNIMAAIDGIFPESLKPSPSKIHLLLFQE